MIDSHIHLEKYESVDLTKRIEEWKSAGIKEVIAVSDDLQSSYRSLELQERFPNFVHAAIGFHPEKLLPNSSDFQEWEGLLSRFSGRITAIGEVGLPHYNLHELPHSLDDYIEFLSICMDIAYEQDLPIALHAVHDKAEIVFRLLRRKQIKKAHFHWLKAPVNVLDQIIDAGYYVSVTPEVCYRARDQKLVSGVPLSQLLVETDGPWEFDGRFNGKLTTPLFLKDIVEHISYIKNESIEFIKVKTYENAIRCYNLKNS